MKTRRMKISSILLTLVLVGMSTTPGCYRGRPSKKPPIHIIPDMDSQPRYDTQEKNEFYPDNLAMRHPVDGTIARGQLYEDSNFATGKDAQGRLVEETPLKITMPFLQNGRQHYDTYCAPCHSRIGDGKGIMVNRGYIPPPTFHEERLRNVEDGHMFDVITNGIRNMPAYDHQISLHDRWAIVAYMRALQRSQNATLEDVPAEQREQLTKK